MRPAVHASSFLRARSASQARRKSTHVFSPKWLLAMVLCGIFLFIPGLAVTIVGIQQDPDSQDEDRRMIFHVVGPLLGMLGVGFMFASCIYYSCYGSHNLASQAASKVPSINQPGQEEQRSIRTNQPNPGQQPTSRSIFSEDGNSAAPSTESRRNRREVNSSGSQGTASQRTSTIMEQNVPLVNRDEAVLIA